MKKISLIILFLLPLDSFGFDINSINDLHRYEAVVIGDITKKKIKKKGNYYFTEYTLRPKSILYKNKGFKEKNKIILRVYGGKEGNEKTELTYNLSPGEISLDKPAAFFLQKTVSKDIFTVTKNGYYYLNN